MILLMKKVKVEKKNRTNDTSECNRMLSGTQRKPLNL